MASYLFFISVSFSNGFLLSSITEEGLLLPGLTPPKEKKNNIALQSDCVATQYIEFIEERQLFSHQLSEIRIISLSMKAPSIRDSGRSASDCKLILLYSPVIQYDRLTNQSFDRENGIYFDKNIEIEHEKSDRDALAREGREIKQPSILRVYCNAFYSAVMSNYKAVNPIDGYK